MPTSPTEFWALVAGISAALTTLLSGALLVVAGRGLHSLNLTKKDMLTRAVREARSTAINCCSEMCDVLIPLNGEILSGLGAAKIPVFVKNAEDVVFGDEREVVAIQTAKQWMGTFDTGLQGRCIHLLNKLERWSMYFTSGLADSKMAYQPCAAVFCSMVLQLYPVLVTLRAGKFATGHYANVVQLFEAWYDTRKNAESTAKMREILDQLRVQQAKGPRATLPAALGTKLE